ncbi:hypothetical protein ACIBG0_28685 [Nocardia sp. NPDC050630]|uniref:hypothetical protein n=1 Tax=Nocardia sp. NPDC050630 TaxID=3364321 RepID=UPI0037A960C2
MDRPDAVVQAIRDAVDWSALTHAPGCHRPELGTTMPNDGRERTRVRGLAREQRILSTTLHHRLCFDPDAVVQAIRDVIDRATLTHPASVPSP